MTEKRTVVAALRVVHALVGITCFGWYNSPSWTKAGDSTRAQQNESLDRSFGEADEFAHDELKTSEIYMEPMSGLLVDSLSRYRR